MHKLKGFLETYHSSSSGQTGWSSSPGAVQAYLQANCIPSHPCYWISDCAHSECRPSVTNTQDRYDRMQRVATSKWEDVSRVYPRGESAQNTCPQKQDLGGTGRNKLIAHQTVSIVSRNTLVNRTCQALPGSGRRTPVDQPGECSICKLTHQDH